MCCVFGFRLRPFVFTFVLNVKFECLLCAIPSFSTFIDDSPPPVEVDGRVIVMSIKELSSVRFSMTSDEGTTSADAREEFPWGASDVTLGVCQNLML